jgi:hypothetical protein
MFAMWVNRSGWIREVARLGRLGRLDTQIVLVSLVGDVVSRLVLLS